MKRIRLLVLEPTEEQLEEVAGNVSKDDIETIKKTMLFSYKKWIVNILRTPLNGDRGVDIEEMEESLDLIKKVKEVKEDEVLDLEKSEHEFLLRKLAATRFFGGMDERMVDFVHIIKDTT